MGAVMDGEATPAQLAALLMGLRMRGETVDELAGFAAAMRERAVHVDAPAGAIDVVGTGGDNSGTFNISTAAALVAAAAGIPVAKHGNRAITSKAGSADVLDALGVRIDHDAASASASLRRHRLRVHVRPELPPGDEARRPDPARDRGPHGVQPRRSADEPRRHDAASCSASADPGAAARIAEVAQRLGTERTFVIHGDGVDELPLDDSGVLYHVSPGGIERHDDPGVEARAPASTPTRRSPAGRPARTPGPSSRSSVASPARSATWCCSMPAPRCSSPARSSSSRQGSSAPR